MAEDLDVFVACMYHVCVACACITILGLIGGKPSLIFLVDTT